MEGHMLEVLDDFIRLPFALGAADRLEGQGGRCPPIEEAAAIPSERVSKLTVGNRTCRLLPDRHTISGDSRRLLSASSMFVRDITAILQ